MSEPSSAKTVSAILSLVVLVVGLSHISNRMWGTAIEKAPERTALILAEEMTVAQFAEANGLVDPIVKEIFGLTDKSNLQRQLSEFGPAGHIRSMVTKKLALAREHGSKNWMKIAAKFGLWFLFLSAVFITLSKRTVTAHVRKWLLFVSAMLFGVIMGSDPSPMGTVKDALHLYATTGALFPPRLIALAVFLAIVILANKYICAWGCQLGTLQDLVFRMNQMARGTSAFGRQIKLPFALTNTIRFMFLCVFTIASFAWSVDIVEPVDPFKIFKPSSLGLWGWMFAGALVLTSPFVYRPWCHLFCPFGFVGWLAEKASFVKVSVNYTTCIACQKCASVCPSTVMGSILKRNTSAIPDCFSCYACREACPTDSIRFSSRRRTLPPPGHFDKGGGRTAAKSAP